MVFFYDLNQIDLGEASHTGHTVYKKAVYNGADGSRKRVIYKENKNDDANLSRFEVAFSNLVSRFLSPNLTPDQILVANERQEIVGVASEHFAYAAAKKEGLATFYTINADDGSWGEPSFFGFTPLKAATADDIPVYFMDQFRPGFFTSLWELYNQGTLDFDMDSLASVLTSSYTLEEDDLHKGNFGFYVVNRGGQKVVVFFKIDNDLMFADSLMSCYDARIVSWSHGDHAFDVTARDLKAFPKLFDSQNHYWPTSKRFIANPIDNKVYSDYGEIDAFVELGKNRDFQKAKWGKFYKHILIPPAVIEHDLEPGFDKNNASERAQLAVIKNATIARQAKLRAVLFSIPEFRSFVRTLNVDAIDGLRREILRGIPDDQGILEQEIATTMRNHDFLCRSNKYGFAPDDTPLHVAIRLGDYRHHETWQAFSDFAEVENKFGEKPLDVAIEMTKGIRPHVFADVRKDPFFTIKSLIRSGVGITDSYRDLDQKKKELIANYHFGSAYLVRAKKINSSNEFLQLMQEIGEDHCFSLKMKKELSLSCMRQFTYSQRKNPQYQDVLLDMKVALNGNEEHEPAPELQFIRQLRSRLWIVRQIRGLLGGTATQVELNELIDNELERMRPSCSSCFCFFPGNRREKEELRIPAPQTQIGTAR